MPRALEEKTSKFKRKPAEGGANISGRFSWEKFKENIATLLDRPRSSSTSAEASPGVLDESSQPAVYNKCTVHYGPEEENLTETYEKETEEVTAPPFTEAINNENIKQIDLTNTREEYLEIKISNNGETSDRVLKKDENKETTQFHAYDLEKIVEFAEAGYPNQLNLDDSTTPSDDDSQSAQPVAIQIDGFDPESEASQDLREEFGDLLPSSTRGDKQDIPIKAPLALYAMAQARGLETYGFDNNSEEVNDKDYDAENPHPCLKLIVQAYYWKELKQQKSPKTPSLFSSHKEPTDKDIQQFIKDQLQPIVDAFKQPEKGYQQPARPGGSGSSDEN